jgi:agmatine/peptidylarginine deiminase
MKKLLILGALSFMFMGTIQAQNTLQEVREKAVQLHKNTPKEVRDAYHKRFNSRQVDIKPSIAVASEAKSGNGAKGVTMPANMWYPGEWEEVEAIVVTWPYDCYSTENPSWYASPLLDGVAELYEYVPMQGWVDRGYGPYVGVMDTSSSYYPVFMNLIDAIQEGAQVWINLWYAEDSVTIKNFMARKGMPLTNYKFIISKGNAFWYRDCGPICFYYGDQDSLAMLDVEYYPGRALDDYLPIHISEQMGIPNYITTVEWEGGNCLVDGAGLLATSDAIYAANSDIYGQMTWDGEDLESITYTRKTGLTRKQLEDSLTYLMNLRKISVLPALKYDGGTGHIDLYADMWDENSFVFSAFPEACSNWVDYRTASKNIDTLCSYTSIHNRNYTKRYIPFPKKNNGTDFTTQMDYNNNYTRTYSNHTFVNNVIVQPVFSVVVDGEPSAQWDKDAMAELRKAYPGYRILPIDVRSFDGLGGAIHCITKQIPADNPIRILHPAITGDANSYNKIIPITATITNRSGIASATCYWKLEHEDTWQTVTLTANGDEFSGVINLEDVSYYDGVRIQYYISATSNNGKTITKPMTAPEGYYNFYIGLVGIQDVDANDGFGSFFPNPANGIANLEISSDKPTSYNVAIVNAVGQTVHTSKLDMEGTILYQIDTQKLKSGVYTVVFTSKNGNVARKLIVY